MNLKHFITMLCLLIVLNSIAYGQENEYFEQQSEHPKGTIKLSVGETITVKNTVRKGSPHFYKIAISAHLKVQVISNTPQTAAFGLHTFIWGELGPIRNSFGGDTEFYSVAPAIRNYEIEKNSDYELAVAAPSGLRQATYNITIKAVASELKAYKFSACGHDTIIRTNLLELDNKLNTIENTLGGRESTNLDIGKENYFFRLHNAIDADLNNNGVNKKIILAECSNAFEAETADYPKSYILYAFDYDDSLLPVSIWKFNINREDGFFPKELTFQNGKISTSFSTSDASGKEKTKTFNLGWQNNKFVDSAAKPLPGDKRTVPARQGNTTPGIPTNLNSNLNQYAFDSCGAKRPVILKSATFAGLKGKGVHKDGAKINDEGLVSLSVGDALLGDLTGDGVDEGLALITCNWGGTGDFSFLVAFNLDAARPVKIAELDEQFSNENYRTEKAVIENQKIVVTYVHQPGKAYLKGARKTQTYVIKNGKFIRDTVRKNKAANNSRPKSETDSAISDAPPNQTIEKAGFTLEVPVEWRNADENNTAVSLAPPNKITQINGKSETSFGITAGITDIKLNAVKGFLNEIMKNNVIKSPVLNTKNPGDATKWLIKETLKLNPGYKQTGAMQKITLDGKPAIQTQISGVSKATRQSEIVVITTALTGDEKLFYLIANYPSNAESANRRVFEEIRNSVRLP
jgi:hypothetical protein